VKIRAAARKRVPLDKSEGAVKDKDLPSVFLTVCFAREVEDQDSGNLTLNHSAAERRSTNHRFDLIGGHDSSMRTSRRYGMRERPINFAV
jgi:hypothetical protein